MIDDTAALELDRDNSLAAVSAALDNDAVASRLTLQDLLVASEKAIATGEFALAAKAMSAAVKLAPGDSAIRYRTGLCLQMANDPEAAEREFRHAVSADPNNAGAYQGLTQILIARQDFDGAIEACRAQARHCGETPDIASQTLTLLIMANRSDEALAEVQKINAGGVVLDKANLRLEAELAHRTGRPDQAIRAAHKAYLAYPDEVDNFLVLARFLCADKRYSLAIPILAKALNVDPAHQEARTMLSSSFAETGNYKEALRAAIPLVRQDPLTTRHWLFAATLATLLGYRDHALGLLREALNISPDDPDVLVALANHVGGDKQYDQAIALLDRAEVRHSDPQIVRDQRRYYLALREEAARPVAPSTPLVKPIPRLSQKQRDRWVLARTPGFLGFMESARIKLRVMTGLVMRDLSHRSAQSKLGIAVNIIEPVLQIVFLGLALSLFNNGRPPLGDRLFFFYATGVLPFYLFLHIVNYNLNVFFDSHALMQVPLINRFDLTVSTALTELLIGAITTTAVFVGFFVFDLAPRTDNIVEAIYAYGATFLFGFGVSLITATLNNLNKVVERFWQSAQRLLYIGSGVFYLPQAMPTWVRDVLAWNPLLHCIEWFRTGFFPQYQPPWLDKGYLITVSLGLILVGVMLQNSLKRRLGVQI